MYVLLLFGALASILASIFLSGTASVNNLVNWQSPFVTKLGWLGSSKSLPSVSVPANWNGFGYLFNITVGTPPQSLTVLSDWAWVTLFTRSARCEGRYDPAHCVAAGQSYFDERASTSYSNQTILPRLRWDTSLYSPDFTVNYATDTVCINHPDNTSHICTTPSTTIQVSDFPFAGHYVPPVPFGGIFGLAPVIPGLNATYHPTHYQAWKQGRAGAQIGFNSCAKLSSKRFCHGGDAKFVFGGTDPSLYDADQVIWYPIVTPPWLGDEMFLPIKPSIWNFWATRWTGGWIVEPEPRPDGEKRWSSSSSSSSPTNYALITPLAVLDDGSEGLGVPVTARQYAELVRRTGGRKADAATRAAIAAQWTSSTTGMATQDWYVVDCATDGRPELVYEFDRRGNYSVGAQEYVQKIYETGECYLNAHVWEHSRTESGDATVISVGDGILKGLYVVLDFERNVFGLAPLKRV
ncbi:eukaryotic aspartyl protease [Aspergillus aculeatinus CBS 121060]|uniref:Eukaryotic aspartyl protease n=1 Tax=Aspergillus aculeatinus CBS 121060 TaxID=1448322 RepID=A0ACD1H405_9EURO|nr:eukaryotic aspartyl protease [Aspergillus aculeatinus CBS 121060]RAH68507.1 eukaryotic aspartyl protease [Aspergillus aculeatinus CBS 121060]